MDGGGPGQRRHLLDPAEQVGVFARGFDGSRDSDVCMQVPGEDSGKYIPDSTCRPSPGVGDEHASRLDDSFAAQRGFRINDCRVSVSVLLRVIRKGVFLPAVARILFALALVASLPVALRAQTIHDGIMLSKGQLFTGGLYTRESWDQYWEGPLKRENDNIGTVTTQVNTWYANYGITDRLNVIGAVPYVWTHASQGVLHGIDGFQDLTLAAKFSALERSSTNVGALRAIGVLSVSIPLTNYNPELPPLSIGSGSTRVSWRGTLNYQTGPGLYRQRLDRLHLAPAGHARPPLLLHGRRVRDERRSRHAGCVRLRRERRLREARPDGRRDLLAAADDRRRRHPPAGHAVRVQPDELLEGGRHGHVPDSQASRAGRRSSPTPTPSTAGTSDRPRRSRQVFSICSGAHPNEDAAYPVAWTRRGGDGGVAFERRSGGEGHRRRRRQLADDRVDRTDAVRRAALPHRRAAPTTRRSWPRSGTRSRASHRRSGRSSSIGATAASSGGTRS